MLPDVMLAAEHRALALTLAAIDAAEDCGLLPPSEATRASALAAIMYRANVRLIRDTLLSEWCRTEQHERCDSAGCRCRCHSR